MSRRTTISHFAFQSELCAEAEVEFILITMAIVKTDRSNRGLETQAYAARPLEAIIIFIPRDLSVIDAPGAAAIGEEDALYLLAIGKRYSSVAAYIFLPLNWSSS